jgi:hypothetical protein
MGKKGNGNVWQAFKGKVQVRTGTRAGWVEVLLTKKDGTQVKAVMKRVGKFYSEREEGNSGDVI